VPPPFGAQPGVAPADRIGISYIPAHVRTIGSHRLSALLVKGRNTGGHFDLLPQPESEFGSAELDRHERVYRRYRQNDAAQCRGSLIDCFETPTVLLTSSQRRPERGGDSLKASQGRSPTCGVESSV
jgi:hypothetical protein